MIRAFPRYINVFNAASKTFINTIILGVIPRYIEVFQCCMQSFINTILLRSIPRYIEVFQCCIQDMAWMLATSHANQLAAQHMSKINNSET